MPATETDQNRTTGLNTQLPDQTWDQIQADPRYQSASQEDRMGLLNMYRDRTTPAILYHSTLQGQDPDQTQEHIDNWYNQQSTAIQNPHSWGENLDRAIIGNFGGGVIRTAGGLERQAASYIEETPNLDLNTMTADGLQSEKNRLQDSIKQIAPQLAAMPAHFIVPGTTNQVDEVATKQAYDLNQQYDDQRRRLQDVNTALSTGQMPQANSVKAGMYEDARDLTRRAQGVEKQFAVDPAYQKDPILGFVGTTAKYVPAMVAGAGAGAIGGPMAGLAASYLVNQGLNADETYHNTYDELIQKGVSPAEADQKSNATVQQNIASALLMTFGQDFFLSGIPGLQEAMQNHSFVRFAKLVGARIAADTAAGGVIGGGMQVSENVARAQAGVDQTFDPGRNVLQSVGAGLGMGFGGGLIGTGLRASFHDVPEVLARRQDLRKQTNDYADQATTVGQAILKRPDLYPGISNQHEAANLAIDQMGIIPNDFRSSVKQVLVRRFRAADLQKTADELRQSNAPQTAAVVDNEQAKVANAPLDIDAAANPAAIPPTGDPAADIITQVKAEMPNASPNQQKKEAAKRLAAKQAELQAQAAAEANPPPETGVPVAVDTPTKGTTATPPTTPEPAKTPGVPTTPEELTDPLFYFINQVQADPSIAPKDRNAEARKRLKAFQDAQAPHVEQATAAAEAEQKAKDEALKAQQEAAAAAAKQTPETPQVVLKEGGTTPEEQDKAAADLTAMSTPEQETIASPAVRWNDNGQVDTGVNHGEAAAKRVEAEKLDWANLNGKFEQGFVTNTGRFVDHREALQIAEKAKQTTGKATVGGELRSGNLTAPQETAEEPTTTPPIDDTEQWLKEHRYYIYEGNDQIGRQDSDSYPTKEEAIERAKISVQNANDMGHKDYIAHVIDRKTGEFLHSESSGEPNRPVVKEPPPLDKKAMRAQAEETAQGKMNADEKKLLANVDANNGHITSPEEQAASDKFHEKSNDEYKKLLTAENARLKKQIAAKETKQAATPAPVPKPKAVVAQKATEGVKTFGDYAKASDVEGLQKAIAAGEKVPVTKEEFEDDKNAAFRVNKFGVQYDPKSGEGTVTDLRAPKPQAEGFIEPGGSHDRGSVKSDVVSLKQEKPDVLEEVLSNATPEHKQLAEDALKKWEKRRPAIEARLADQTRGKVDWGQVRLAAYIKYLIQLAKNPGEEERITRGINRILNSVVSDAIDKAITKNKGTSEVRLDKEQESEGGGDENTAHDVIADPSSIAASPGAIAAAKEDGVDPEEGKTVAQSQKVYEKINAFNATLKTDKDKRAFRQLLEDIGVREPDPKRGRKSDNYDAVKERFQKFVRESTPTPESRESRISAARARLGRSDTGPLEPAGQPGGEPTAESKQRGTAASPSGAGGKSTGVNDASLREGKPGAGRLEVVSPADRPNPDDAQTRTEPTGTPAARDEQSQRTDQPGSGGTPRARGDESGPGNGEAQPTPQRSGETPPATETGAAGGGTGEHGGSGSLTTPQFKESNSTRPELSEYKRAKNLKEAAQIAADKIRDPVARAFARKIASLVPEAAQLRFFDDSAPFRMGEQDVDMGNKAAAYHPSSQTAFVNDKIDADILDRNVLHEAVHAALDSFLNADPKVLSLPELAARNDFLNAWANSRVAYTKEKNPPAWLTYATSSRDEFAAAVVSDPRFQKWLKNDNMPGILAKMLGGGNNEGSPFHRAMEAILKVAPKDLPPTDQDGGPMHASPALANVMSWGTKVKNWKGWQTMRMAAAKYATTTRNALGQFKESEDLIDAADNFNDKFRALSGRIAQPIAELMRDIDKEQTALERVQTKFGLATTDRVARFSQVFSDIQERIDNPGKTGTPLGSDPLVTIYERKLRDIQQEIGDRMRAAGFKVQEADGSWSPFNPKTHWTGVLRSVKESVRNIMQDPYESDGVTLKPEAKNLFLLGQNTFKPDGTPYWKDEAEFNAFRPKVTMAVSGNPAHFGIEQARMTELPTFFYDYGPEAVRKRMLRDAYTLVRLENYGQKGPPGQKDKFDEFIDGINANQGYSQKQKELALSNAELLRDEVYRKNYQDNVLATVRAGTAALQTGNPFTSLKVGISRAFYTVNNAGLWNTTKALFDVMKDMRGTRDQARTLGILGDMQNIEGDGLLSKSAWQNKMMQFSRAAIELGGHGVINRLANVVDLQAEKNWLAGAINSYQKDMASPSGRLSPLTQEMAGKVARRGLGLSLGDIVAESQHPNDPRPQTEAFLRKMVTDTQTSYNIMDLPGWAKTPVGKLAFQYQPWAFNVTRMLLKELVMPTLDHLGQGSQALREGRGQDASDHFQIAGIKLARTLFWAASGGVVANEAQNLLQQFFGRSTMQSGLGDFLARLDKYQDGGRQISAILHRAVDDIVTGSFLGMAGDYARQGMNEVFHRNELAHTWNPFDTTQGISPAISAGQELYGVFKKLWQQNGVLSDEDKDHAIGNMVSGWRSTKDALNTIGGWAGGSPIPGFAESQGRREKQFVRSKLDEFYNANPELDHRDLGGPQITSRNSPIRVFQDNINDAIFANDPARARDIFNQMVESTGLKRAEAMKLVRDSLQRQQPLPQGRVPLKLFAQWGQRNLSDGEFERAQNAQQTFTHTAQAAGFFKAEELSKHQMGYSQTGKKFQAPVILADE